MENKTPSFSGRRGGGARQRERAYLMVEGRASYAPTIADHGATKAASAVWCVRGVPGKIILYNTWHIAGEQGDYRMVLNTPSRNLKNQ